MIINKFQGTTKEEAIEKAKEQMGNDVVIMNVKEIKPKGFFKVFKSSTFEVTASVEEKESSFSQMMDNHLCNQDYINNLQYRICNRSALQ